MRPGMIAAMIAAPSLRFVARLALLAAVLCAPVGLALAREGSGLAADGAEARARTVTRANRLVSLNPSLTAIVVRLGAADALVGIDDYSARVVPELADRPRVGGLFDPSLEAVMALSPDRVLLVAGLEQEAHGAALRRLGLVVEIFENERYEQVLANVDRL